MSFIDIDGNSDPLVQQAVKLSDRDPAVDDASSEAAKDKKAAKPVPTGFDMRKLNDVVKTIVAKGTKFLAEGLLAEIPGIGILSPSVSAVLNQFLESAPTKEDVIKEKLDGLGKQLKEIAQNNDENQLVKAIDDRLLRISEVSVF